ncbi:M56 family metallopeptidase [Conexibacter stalactiti]|uniref:M56 family metallopeptidase n=1 Tax=Conexibacter stalactiti TaxID=1940611 RepID=A0ABU4HSD2_9ACTN|nr:M56 family metallopeptidase [Conexibacter stalactiti]MDW5596228.1 M56 family metallopeptidase [Conexibacter stalactiti]MEC5036870.1 M56 family metallopeptidase [Conexibacter stalactiti]
MHEPQSGSTIHALLALLGALATIAAVAAVAGAVLLADGAPAHAIDHAHEPLLAHLVLEWPLVSALAVLAAIAAWRGLSVVRAHARAAGRMAPALAAARPQLVAGIAVGVIDDLRPASFCAGLRRPRVYVTRGLLEALAPDGAAGARDAPTPLRALLAHEDAHARRRDPLRRLACELASRALFFLPVLRPLCARSAALAELRADAAAVAACGGDPRPLARALLAVERAQRTPLAIDPERIDSLAGVRVPWAQPAGATAAALGTLALVLACPVLAVEHTTGRALDLAPFGLHLCLAVVLALPCAAAATLQLARAARQGLAPVPSAS